MKSETGGVVRKAPGAGRWFPGDENSLKKMVNDFVEKATVPKIEGRIVSCIAPHAGYVYSGKIAGYTFRAVRDNAKTAGAPETVVILGFSHSAGFQGVALMDGDAIRTPLGTARLDAQALSSLTNGNDRIFADYSPHAGEHSAENQVPFVQAVLPDAKLVVALMGDHDKRTLDQLVTALNALAKTRKILLVASTDMLHDPDYELVTGTDRDTLKKVTALDHKAIEKAWSPARQIFCGVIPVVTAMRFAEAQGCKEGTMLFYRNNGDDDPSARGNWVVGYGSAVFCVK